MRTHNLDSLHLFSRSVTMDQSDTDALRYAVQLLERPSLAAHIADVVGTPIETLLQKLPAGCFASYYQSHNKKPGSPR